jgi:hypothetical protein
VKFYPQFVSGGVYLRTETGELIGRLDDPGEPFETLEEAREKADWLEMVLKFQQMRNTYTVEQVASPPKRSGGLPASQICT